MAYKPKNRLSLEHSTKILTGGDEPIVTQENYREEFIRAINWYNANRDEKDYRAYAEYYVKHTPTIKDCMYALSKSSFFEIKGIALIGRLIRRGQHVALDDMMKALNQLQQLKTKYQPPPVKKEVTAKAEVVTIQDRIADTARGHLGEVEGLIDDFCNTGNTFSMKSYLTGNHVSGVVSKKIAEFYQKRVEELELTLKGTDKDLVEGYSNFTKKGLRQFVEFLKGIINDCLQQVVSAKAMRKPRARKAKPPSVLVRKVAYLKEFADLNLKSVPPEKIVGAAECWVYNTATRKFAVFYGADNGFLSVSGTSITNFDVSKSGVKTLRKPEEFFKKLSSTGKRAMSNAWKEIKSKAGTPRSRLNSDTIIFAVN